ncbi:MAG: PEP/pyruvate-binding domain-containing protein [bacterium]
MRAYIRWLCEIGLEDVGEVGGKAAHLGSLTRAGFPVPRGFSILAAAFDLFMEENRLRARASALLGPADLKDLGGLRDRCESLRHVFLEAILPEPIERVIRAAYGVLSAQEGSDLLPVSVRSSVTTPDLARTSFPGQMDTYHNIRDADALPVFVKRCWASVWSFGAVAHRIAIGLDPFFIRIAPVVQRFLPADAAGVLFTVNPLDASAPEMVIDACFGLGEAVVSGRFEQDRFVVGRNSTQVLSERIGRKARRIAADAGRGQGTRELAVPEEEAVRPCLRKEQILELAETGKAIERHFGAPQDIEWAYAEGSLHILQSRPARILSPAVSGSRCVGPASGGGDREAPPSEWTSASDTPVDPARSCYTAANIREAVPGVLTPLSLEGLRFLENGFREANRRLGILSGRELAGKDFFFVGSFYGRAFLNLSAFREITSRVPGASAWELEREEADADPGAAAVGKRGILAHPFFLGRVGVRALARLHRLPREARECRARVEQKARADRDSIRSREVSNTELRSLLEAGRGQAQEAMTLHLEVSQFAVFFYEALRRLTARWLGDRDGSLAARLVAGLGTLESARPGWELRRLADRAARSPVLREIFAAHRPGEIGPVLERAGGPEEASFKAELAAFMDRYGHRGAHEAELMAPSWAEDPGFVYGAIRSFLARTDLECPEALEGRQAREGKQAESAARAGLRPWRRPLFGHVLARARRFIVLREAMKETLVRGLAVSKLLFRTAGSRLFAAGALEDCHDVYFLREDEMLDLLGGRAPDPGLRERLERRKREYHWNQRVDLPERFEGRPSPLRSEPEPKPRGAGLVLRGIPASPGRACGPARVVTDLGSDLIIEPGEILVVPVADAAWAQLFLLAAGLVVEMGGLLSHGSIVAREYGLPAVVNVKKATACLRTGQRIEVDGNSGEVRALEGDCST